MDKRRGKVMGFPAKAIIIIQMVQRVAGRVVWSIKRSVAQLFIGINKVKKLCCNMIFIQIELRQSKLVSYYLIDIFFAMS